MRHIPKINAIPPSKLDLKVDGLNNSDINNLISSLYATEYQARKLFAQKMEFELRKVAPRDTGNLKNKIHINLEGKSNLQIKGVPNYTKYVIEGHGAIEPVHKKVLHYYIDGKEIFSKSSKPVKGNDFIYHAFIKATADLDSIAKRAIAIAIRDK